MSVSLRLATPADVARLQAVEIDAGARFRTIGLDAIAQDQPPTEVALLAHIVEGRAWVAEVSAAEPGAVGAVVPAGPGAGRVVVGYASSSVVDGEGHLDQVSVIGAAAGAGIGAMLVDEVCRWAAASGYRAVSLTTFRDVPWNGPYYRRLGFVDLPEQEWGPQLRAVREAERRSGVEVRPRIAMRKALKPGPA